VTNDPQHLSYYERLGIPEDASVEGIERAYRELRKQFHPDTKPPAYRRYFDHSMKGINEAYDVLKDPGKRQRYDLKLSKERRSTQEGHQKPRQKHNKGWNQKRRKAEEEKRQRRNETHYYILNRENYEHGLRALQRNIDILKGLLREHQANLAGMKFHYEDISATLAIFLESAEAKQNPQTRLRVIEHYKETMKRVEQTLESARVSSLSSLQGLEEKNDHLLRQLLYAENHLSNLHTERRNELQSVYNRLIRQHYALFNDWPDY
jgi:hypothetical protein